MKRMLSIAAVAAVAVFSSGVDAGKTAVPTAGPSEAVTNEIVDAIAGEVERSKSLLRVPNEPAPYYIGHKITEVDVNDVVASLGSTTWKKKRHFVTLDARVHVGSYAYDNSNFVVVSSEFTDGHATIALPMEATPRIARRAAWLATDTAYKEALEQMRAKEDTRRSSGSGDPNLASYTKQPPVVQEEPVLVPALESAGALERRAQAISSIFRDQPHIRDSRVAFTSFLERRWYIDTEGTSAHDTRRVSGVLIVATSQADDGQELALLYTHYGITGADLPGDDQLVAEAKKLAQNLDELRKAPVIENYTGPVLFEGEGAADVVRYTLTHQLSGTPLPEGMAAPDAKQLGGGLSDLIGRVVLSPLLSITDDPTATRAGKTALIGSYRFDDEGVPARRVAVIKNGELKTLLTSRTPSKTLKTSNGHARRAAPGGVYHGSTTNLFIDGRRGKSRKQLVSKLLAEAKKQKLPYAVIIRRLDDAAATSAPEFSNYELIHMLRRTDREQPPIAALAYRVYPNGKEELVRGVQLDKVDLRAWKDIIAVGRKKRVFNYLSSGEPPINHKIAGVGDGSVPSAGVESAVITPDLLFEELKITGSAAGRRDKPFVPRP